MRLKANRGWLGLLLLAIACASAGDDPLLEDVDSLQQGLTKPTGTNGDANYCDNPAAPCVSGEGDCDAHTQCAAPTRCGPNNGPKFLHPVGADVCVPTHCYNKKRDGNETFIDCGGSCSAPGFNCLAAACGNLPAQPSTAHCTPDCPCPSGQADCDSNAECQAGTICGTNNGAKFGWEPGVDVCVPSTCVNGVLNAGETTVDCGGACGSCGQFAGIGDLPGGLTESFAHAVNSTGSVIVGRSNSANGVEAFRWTTTGGMVGIGDLPGGTFSSTAFGVSLNGNVVVGRGTSANGTEGFNWTPSGMVGIGDLPGGSFDSEAFGVSSGGTVVVGPGRSALGQEAFRWTGGVMTPLGDLAGGTFLSQAWAANSTGTVIVGRSNSANGSEAFRWTGGVMTGLGDLPGGLFASHATAVNSNGNVIAGNANSAGGVQAFRWTAGGMVGIGFPAGTTESFAFGINSAGTRIVGTATNGVTNTAFLWSTTAGMQTLASILAGQGANTAGWTLQIASALSADGTVIVGYGINPSGNTEAFRTIIP